MYRKECVNLLSKVANVRRLRLFALFALLTTAASTNIRGSRRLKREGTVRIPLQRQTVPRTRYLVDSRDGELAIELFEGGNEIVLGNLADLQYTGTVAFGTPPQEHLTAFDTGSSSTWAHDSATVPPSQSTYFPHVGFDRSRSETYAHDDKTATLRYGSGDMWVDVEVGAFLPPRSPSATFFDCIPLALLKAGKDTVRVGSWEAGGVTVAVATDQNPHWWNFKLDGLFGLAFPALSKTNSEETAFQQLADAMSQPHVFSFYLNSVSDPDAPDSALVLGGADLSRAAGEEPQVFWVPITRDGRPDYLFWSVTLWRVGLHNATSGAVHSTFCDNHEGCTGIVDSGTSLLLLKPDMYNALVNKLVEVLGGACYAVGSMDVVCSLDAIVAHEADLPTLSLTMEVSSTEPSGGHTGLLDFSLTPSEYFCCGSKCSDSQSSCVLLVGYAFTNILGDTFMRSYVTIFDMESSPPRVGFAPTTTSGFPTPSDHEVPHYTDWLMIIGIAALSAFVLGVVLFTFCRERPSEEDDGVLVAVPTGDARTGEQPRYRAMSDP